jgi:hypothetical protein
MTDEKLLLLGCGVLKKEILMLIKKNGWPLETSFLDSSLHCEFDKLAHFLNSAFAAHQHRNVIVFYGCCHPLMEEMLEEAKTFRTEGQNCVDMLLGHELFMAELAKGAFFLLEEWARTWEEVITRSFGTRNLRIIREMFHGDREYLLCIRTPCSADFSAEAEAAGKMVDMPLRWMDSTLEHLESVMEVAVTKRMRGLQWLT